MDIIITTTDSIEGAAIVRYIDVLRCSMVVNTDIALSDLLAGTSQKYRSQLNSIYDKTMLELRLKGAAVGADAIVGLHTDFEEIFGKGKTKFVVSMVGTAVKLDHVPSTASASAPAISRDVLRRNQLLITLRNKMQDDNYALGADDWDGIMRYSLAELAPFIYRRYLILAKETISNTPLNEKRLLLNNFIPFMQSIGYEEAAHVAYGDITTAPYCTRDVVRECQLFHPAKIESLLQPENKHFVISILNTDKAEYNLDDLKRMRNIETFLDNLPDTGHYVEGRDSLFGKNSIMLVCERGHTSAVRPGGHCTEMLERGMGICNLNVKGITEAEVEDIRQFKEKISVLGHLLENGGDM